MAEDNQNEVKDEVLPDIAPLDPTGKKKNNKSVRQDTADVSVDKLTENLAVSDGQKSTPSYMKVKKNKTVVENFMNLCTMMGRDPIHVKDFWLAELGTSGSLDEQQRLVVKGRFAPENFEGIVRRYVNEYVICIVCKSLGTTLSEENRLLFLSCEKCGSERSVPSN